MLGTILLWGMLLWLWDTGGARPSRWRLAGALLGALCMLVGLRLGGDIDAALIASVAMLLLGLVWYGIRGWRGSAGQPRAVESTNQA